MGENNNYKELIEKAKGAMENAYAPYSDFKVGAALLAKDGRIFSGCNVENAAYGPSNCAERTAIFKAVSEGVRDFEAIAIVGGKAGAIEDFCPPCGVCRQVMSEFCDKDFRIVLEGKDGAQKTFTLGELLPESFSL